MVLETQSAAATAAAEFCRGFERACRESRMYPAGHRTLVAGLEQLEATLARAVEHESPLRLTIGDTVISLRDEIVYAGSPNDANLAFVLFRDGIRELALHQGVEREELVMLVDIVANVDAIDRWEHDLATTFWEADFRNVEYVVADAATGEVEISPELVDVLRDVVLRRLAQAEQAKGPGERGEEERRGGWASRVPGPAEDPVQKLLDAPVDKDGALPGHMSDPCPLDNMYLFLAELLPAAESKETALTLLRTLTAKLGQSLLAEDRETAEFLVRRLRDAVTANGVVAGAMGEREAGAPELKRALRLLLEERSESEAGDRFLLDDSDLRPLLVPALLELLVDEEDRAVRRSLLGILNARHDLPASLILGHMSDTRWYVVRNMLQLLAASPDLYPVSHLEPVLRYPDVRVRKEVIRAIERVASAKQETGPFLLQLLRDEDSGVRALAARVVGHRVGAAGLEQLLAQTAQPDFVRRNESEIEAFLDAVARLAEAGVGRSRAVGALDAMWRRRLWRRKPEAVRRAALKALAAVPGHEAEACLQDAARSREAAIRGPASELLRRRLEGGQAQ